MSEKRAQGPKIFYGWWVVVAVGIGLSLSFGPIIVYTFGVFFKAVSQEFNWNRTEVSLAFSLSVLVVSGMLPLVGRLVDRYGARRVLVPCVLVFGLSLISFQFIPITLWRFYLIYLLLGVVGAGTTPVPYNSVLSHWFDRRRGLALGLSTIGVGVSTIFMPPFAYSLITTVGWRAAYMIMGLIVVVVTVPVIAIFLKETPQMMGLLPDGQQVTADLDGKQSGAQQGISCREARRTPAFWIMCAAFFLVSLSINGCLIHLVPMLTDRGISAPRAAFAASLLGGATLLGRAGTGYLLDRFFASHVAFCFFSGAGLGIFILWGGAVGGLAFLAAILVGLGNGAESDIMAYQVSRYFGLHSFSEIYGYVLALYSVGAVVGPLLMGMVFDSRNSYDLVLLVLLLALLTAAVLLMWMGPYRIWETAQATGEVK